MQQMRREFLIRYLLNENPAYADRELPADPAGQKRLLRALMNVRPPKPADPQFLQIQEDYLAQELSEKGIVRVSDLFPWKDGIYLWQGDITRLAADAIVNAANSGMTGCYVPNHTCIDNCIHTFAGTRLRLACAEQMKKQGHEEPAGQAKITPGFSLPCHYVIHTVGPIVRGTVTKRDEELLVSCYRSCLELAEKNECESIAFCCISTGVFCFPNEEAAEIAVETVTRCRKETGSHIKVIFNVFKNEDFEIYRRLLIADGAPERSAFTV